MSLIFADSFDHYTTLSQKWNSFSGNGAGTITSAAARTGLNGLSLGGSSQGYSATKNIPATSTVIVGFALNVQSGSTLTVLQFADASGAQVSLQLGSGSLQFLRGGSFGTAIGPASTGTVPTGTFVYIEAKVTISNGSGSVECHVNGVAVIPSTTGLNTQGSSTTNVTNFTLIGPGGTPWYFDDVYCCNNSGSFNNTFLGDTAVECVLPTGNGSTNNWSIGGSAPAATNWQSVNENPPDDGTTFVDDSNVGDIDLYTYPTVSGSSVSAVVVNLRASTSSVGTRAIRAECKSGSTSADNGSDFSLGTTFTDYQGIFETDPNTSAAWTPSGVNSASFGQKVSV